MVVMMVVMMMKQRWFDPMKTLSRQRNWRLRPSQKQNAKLRWEAEAVDSKRKEHLSSTVTP
jgi:hypothetical protein